MRACTAVVTELAYHDKRTIDADISFLSEVEWREELAILLTDLIDEDGRLKRSTDLKSDAGIAWQKVHAVYPTISQEQLIHMSADQIIAQDQTIAKILGVTKKIVAPDSKIFAKEIGKYIDSKDQKRGDKKDNEKKSKKKTLMDKVREASGTSRTKDKKVDADGPALWPLIRQVNVRCNSAALATGAILVDLPGVADANAARNNIAKDYMKKCDCIWILAPITRAVDDKTARGTNPVMNSYGNYDDHAITFIASKCDDVSCSEVIRALRLEDEPELEEIEARLEGFDEETTNWKATKGFEEKSAKAIEKDLKRLRAVVAEYEEHLEALNDGKPFTPSITAKNAKAAKAKAGKASKKRKNARGGKKGSAKRHRSSDFDEDDSMDSDSNSDIDSDSDSEDEQQDSDIESKKSDIESDSGSDDGENDQDNEEEEVTQEFLKERIKETKASIKSGRKRLSDSRKQKKDAVDALATLKKNIAKAQREKNAFCSLKRSEFSRDVLKEDFRVGLKDLDDAAAEERDPDNFDPSHSLRDYDAIDLPVFTCSSRDYVRLKGHTFFLRVRWSTRLIVQFSGQVKGDGEPTCFSNARDTGIPQLQKWCHQLTISSRERTARNFLAHLKTFTTSVQSYVQGIGDVTVADREDLRQKWESGNAKDDHDDEHEHSDDGYGKFGVWPNSDDPFADIYVELGGNPGAALYSMHKEKPAPKVDELPPPPPKPLINLLRPCTGTHIEQVCAKSIERWHCSLIVPQRSVATDHGAEI
ncbi:hypothetical protein H0H87_005667 [Tephrocybe sp. NHM501043]|nr:hypothetical protein H0H87_005667 [Tephrocybe sp. NHM501043]